MTNKTIERIYVGGLDPSRGLTVELVASRLCDIKDIEIHSINDVAITQYKEMQNNGKSVNNSKRAVFDEDGDLVDTRKFFYVEASVATPTLEATPTMSALGLLAKQYNGVKWMGCNLRVEAARPHFLKRLEQERKVRNHESIDEHANRDEIVQSIVTDEKVFKNRRRLRVRKRFGEEAFHVDTVPHAIELRYDIDDEDVEGWRQFSTLHTRMQDKWQSQHRKLVERRKIERRLWASGKKIEPISATEKNDDLRSLMFLNRGIHIRFNDHDGSRKDNSPVATSSALSSDTEDSLTHEEEESNINNAYVWSDDSGEGDDSEDDYQIRGDEGDIQITGSVTSDKNEAEKQYRWSDDETEEDHSTLNCTIDITQELEAKGSINRPIRKTMVDGSDYTRAVAIDEFSGGLDFDSVINSHDGDFAVSDGDDELESGDEEQAQICLDDDIRSNMDILSQLFPDAYFEKKPLAAPLTSSGVNDESLHAKVDISGQSHTIVGGNRLIMHRYDPTKEEDKRFEMARTEEFVSGSEAQTEDILEQDIKKTTKDAAVSNESTLRSSILHEKDLSATASEEHLSTTVRQDQEEIAFQSEERNLLSNADNVESEVYEQDKLEDVFKQGRNHGEEPGGFAFGFLSQTGLTTMNESPGNAAPFSFGFGPNADTSDLIPRPESFEENNNKSHSDAGNIVSNEQEIEVLPKSKQVKRKRFSEQELDRFEDLFFSLNEGHHIMKQETANQEIWQKERQVLTADWKRKQKAALSRKGKKVRGL